MFDKTEPLISSSSGRTLTPASINMKGTRSLARLRNRVDLTIKELERLRNENNKLRRDLERAANQPSINVEGTPVVFSESGQELKSRIEACIRAIDAHIDGKHIDGKHVDEKRIDEKRIDEKRIDEKQIDETQMAEKQEV